MLWPGTGSQKHLWLVNSKICRKRKLTVPSGKYTSGKMYHQQGMIDFELAKSSVSHEVGPLASVTKVSVAPMMSLNGMRKDREIL